MAVHSATQIALLCKNADSTCLYLTLFYFKPTLTTHPPPNTFILIDPTPWLQRPTRHVLSRLLLSVYTDLVIRVFSPLLYIQPNPSPPLLLCPWVAQMPKYPLDSTLCSTRHPAHTIQNPNQETGKRKRLPPPQHNTPSPFNHSPLLYLQIR